MTTVDAVPVRGSANHPAGVTSVTLAGTAARSNDAFETWRADLPLSFGGREVLVDAVDGTGATHTDLAGLTLLRTPLFDAAGAIAIDRARATILVASSPPAQLIEIDRISGARSLVARPDPASGDAWTAPGDLALHPDGLSAYIADGNRLLQVDRTAGWVRVLSSPNHGLGPAIAEFTAIAIHSDDTIIALDRRSEAVLRVDRHSGLRSRISNVTQPGPPLAEPTDLELHPRLDQALVTTRGGVVAVDLGTGARSLVSGRERGLGPLLESPAALVPEPDGNRVLVHDAGRNELTWVDLSSGSRIRAATATGLRSILFAGTPPRVYAAADGSSDALLAIDLEAEPPRRSCGPGWAAAPASEPAAPAWCASVRARCSPRSAVR